MISVSFKFQDGTTECLAVESIFTDCLESDEVVLHFSADVPFIKLLNLSLKYNWGLYKYAEDGHVGLTVNANEIFMVKYY